MKHETEMWICEYHNIAVKADGDDYCPQCLAERETLPAVETMTAEERAIEFEFWINRNQLTVPWNMFLNRLETLLGRGIWTHELSTSNCPRLVREAWGEIPRPQYLDEIITKLPEHLRQNVIPVNPNSNSIDTTASDN